MMMTGTLDLRRLADLASRSAAQARRVGRPLLRGLFFSAADDAVFPGKSLAVVLEKGRLSVALGAVLFSRVTVRGVRAYPFAEGKFPEPEEAAASLVLAANELGAARPGVTLSIPKSWAVVTTAEFPSTIRENIAEVVAYELDRITPFSADDAYYDFAVLKETGGRLTLLVMAARADAVRPYIRALTEKGFTVERLTVSLAGVGTLCRRMSGSDDSLVMIADAAGYEAGLFAAGLPVQTSSGSFPSGEEAAMVEVINAELEALVDHAKKQGYNPAVFALLKDTRQTLAELFKLKVRMPVKMLAAPDPGIRFSTPPREVPFAAAGALLQSLRPKARGLNLLRKGLEPRRKVPAALTIALLCGLAGLWIFYMVAPLRFEERKIREISRQIASRKDEVRKVEAMKKEADAIAAEIGLIDGFRQDKAMTINLLRELTTVLPKSTWLTRTRITETTVELEGYASSATELLPKLEASQYFKKVEFASPTFRDARMNSDRFMIKMEIRGARKNEEKPKEEKPKGEKK